MTRRTRRRGGFTLIELLVTIAIIAGLTAMTMMFSVWSLDRDRAASAVNQLTGAANTARSRAHRDGLPHGIRLIVNSGNPRVTTVQFIQSPAVYVPNLAGPTDQSRFVQFEYTLDASGQVPAAPPYTATNVPRRCRIQGLSPEQSSQVTVNSILYLPTLGTWHRITGVGLAAPGVLFVDLDEYPDAQLGAATHLRTYHFGLYGAPRGVLGEEVMQLPEYSCVDLSPNHSFPQGNGFDYDLLWAPNGRLVTVPPPSPNTGAVGLVVLWVRDPTRPDNLTDGGEQLLVAIKAQSGAVGSAPIDRGPDPYFLARKAVAGH
jgi:prepilin-type N-terminal cleavage/methylation domain-containing protein